MNEYRTLLESLDLIEALESKTDIATTDTTSDPVDLVTVDVPLLIRLFELMKETVQDDAEIHNITSRIVDIGKTAGGPLTMEHYDAILNGDEVNEAYHLPDANDSDLISDLLKLTDLMLVKEAKPTLQGYKTLAEYQDAVGYELTQAMGGKPGYKNLSKNKNLEW